MSEMVDRVARIIGDSDPFFESYHRIAVRVIEAMREPTEQMLRKSTAIPPTMDDVVSLAKWQAMIDEALK
jgi:hypothetical protein